MDNKKEMTKKFKLVSMDEVDITTEEKPIIGTHALATCVGVLLYCEEKKRAIVAHASSNGRGIAYITMNLIFDNDMSNSIIKYKIIAGPDNNYNLKEELTKIYESLNPMFVPFNEKEIPSNAIEIDKNTVSTQFAFDASIGEFVTDKVLFGIDYLAICEENKKFSGKGR